VKQRVEQRPGGRRLLRHRFPQRAAQLRGIDVPACGLRAEALDVLDHPADHVRRQLTHLGR
jgi:hypothetical protein